MGTHTLVILSRIARRGHVVRAYTDEMLLGHSLLFYYTLVIVSVSLSVTYESDRLP